MLNALDRFLAGNPKALALIRVPTQEQEQRRSQTRLRQSLRRDLLIMAQRGRGVAMQYGYRLKGVWYGRRNWPQWLERLPAWLTELLAPLRHSALFLYDHDRRLVYRGQFDDSRPANPIPVTGSDLRAATDAVLENRSPSANQKPSVGCNIKWRVGSEPEYFAVEVRVY